MRFLRQLLIAIIFTSASYIAFAMQLPSLPEGVANNAVVQVSNQDGEYLISFMGLGPQKTYKDVHNKVWALKLGSQQWQQKSSVPSSLPLKGRLASIAASIGDKAYIFGGYTVAEDHQEISSPDSFKYDVLTDTYQKIAPMPVAVDDSDALVYQQRYIYLISGWHNAGNVNLVQVYDSKTDTWLQGSPFLGTPVFGQAAAISGNTIVVCDGVIVKPNLLARRSYAPTAQCLKGVISKNSPATIDWQLIKHPTGKGRYRMAATAVGDNMYFIGGSHNPYNYNGIGYNKVPSQASNEIWIFNSKTNAWQLESSLARTMDHRGLLYWQKSLITIGGMNSQQQVLADAIVHKILD